MRSNAQSFHLTLVCRTDFLRLTCRANQGHITIIADIVRPAPENRQRAFCLRRCNPQRQFQMIEPVSLHFPQFIDGPKKNLTRRANQGQINIIAKSTKARAEQSAAGFFVGGFRAVRHGMKRE